MNSVQVAIPLGKIKWSYEPRNVGWNLNYSVLNALAFNFSNDLTNILVIFKLNIIISTLIHFQSGLIDQFKRASESLNKPIKKDQVRRS